MSPTEPPSALLQHPLSARLDWMVVMRGVCSLWIVYFHVLAAYRVVPYPQLSATYLPELLAQWAGSNVWVKWLGFGHDLLAAMSLHAVGIFILLSGFGLTRSLLWQGAATVSWRDWFKKRFWRLYPFFWFAHLVFLVAPFIWQEEPIDWRFFLSLSGIRAYPMEMMLYYANPAWWFFWLILQLYLFYPLLFEFYRRVHILTFLFTTIMVTIFFRWLILFVWQDWRGMIMGGLFTARLAEFAFGMALAWLWHRNPDLFTRRVTARWVFAAALLFYPASLLLYTNTESYLFVDMATTMGLFFILAFIAHRAITQPVLRRALVWAGTVSLSTFLLHHPWALTLGESLQGQSVWIFAISMLIFLFAMAWIAFFAERLVARVLVFFKVQGISTA